MVAPKYFYFTFFLLSFILTTIFTFYLKSFTSGYIGHVIQGIFQVQVLIDIITPTQPLLSQSSRQCFIKVDC